MLYVFDLQEKLIGIIDEEQLISCGYTLEINVYKELSVEMTLNSTTLDLLARGMYIGLLDKGNLMLFNYDYTHSDTISVKGLDRGYMDLKDARPIEDKRPQNVDGHTILNIVLEGTGYQEGTCDVENVASTNFYYISPLEAIKQIVSTWICEVSFRYTFADNRIVGRYVDLVKRQGRKTGLQFEHGDNVLEVKRKVERTNIVTALIGRGKGEEKTDELGEATGAYGRRIQFTDVVWTTDSGKPINKPAGQNYIAFDHLLDKHGLWIDGQLKHRWGIYTNEDITDPAVLLELTYKQLQILSSEQYEYTAKVMELNRDIHLGDSIAVIYGEYIAVEVRVLKMKVDVLNHNRTTVELGEFNDYRTTAQKNDTVSLTLLKDEMVLLKEVQHDIVGKHIESQLTKAKTEIDEQIRRFQLDMDTGFQQAGADAQAFEQELTGKVERKFGEVDRKVEGIEQRVETIDALRDNLKKVGTNGRLVTEIVGHDGKMKYSKNRLDLDFKPNELLTYEEGVLKIKHNGLGFIPGQKYTISFTMEEIERPHSRAEIYTNIGATIALSPQVNNRYPTKHGAIHNKVYNDTYLVKIELAGKAPIVLTKQLQSDWSIRIDLHDLEPYISQRIVGAKIETIMTNNNAIHTYGHYGSLVDSVKIGEW